MVLKTAVEEAQKKYFQDAVTDADYMNAVMVYYKANLHVMRMAIPGVQNELSAITNRYKDHTDDEHILAWANDIKRFFAKKKCIKNTDFNPIEYLAVNYIAGNHGSNGWANL